MSKSPPLLPTNLVSTLLLLFPLLVVIQLTAATADYNPGPLFDISRPPFLHRAAASNTPRLPCPGTLRCRILIGNRNVLAGSLRNKRKAVIALVIGIVRGSGDSGATLPRLVREEKALTDAMETLMQRIRDEDCEGCGRLRGPIHVIRPERLLERECGKLQRMMRAFESMRAVLEKKMQRAERGLAADVIGDKRRGRLNEVLQGLQERKEELMEKRGVAAGKAAALGCGR